MSRKYKITVLTLVGMAVLAIFLLSNLGLFVSGEEQAEAGDGQFKPTADPYSAYTEALGEGKPIVIEFYARW